MHQDANRTSADVPALSRVQLDAHPRLCGLPVTIERLVPATSVPALAEWAAAARPAPPKRPVGRTVVVLIVVAATVLAVASEARAQAPVPRPHAGTS